MQQSFFFVSLLCYVPKKYVQLEEELLGNFYPQVKTKYFDKCGERKIAYFLKNVVFGISFCTQKKDINQSVNQSINYKQYNINVYTFFLSYPSENLSRQIIFSSAAVMHVCVRYMDLYLVQENYSIIIYKNFSFYISLFYLQLSTDQKS